MNRYLKNMLRLFCRRFFFYSSSAYFVFFFYFFFRFCFWCFHFVTLFISFVRKHILKYKYTIFKLDSLFNSKSSNFVLFIIVIAIVVVVDVDVVVNFFFFFFSNFSFSEKIHKTKLSGSKNL